MLFFSWLYSVEHDKFKPRIPAGATQEDLIRISRFYDLAPENPQIEDMAEALSHLPLQDILQNINGTFTLYPCSVAFSKLDVILFFYAHSFHSYHGSLRTYRSQAFQSTSITSTRYGNINTSQFTLMNHVVMSRRNKNVRDSGKHRFNINRRQMRILYPAKLRPTRVIQYTVLYTRSPEGTTKKEKKQEYTPNRRKGFTNVRRRSYSHAAPSSRGEGEGGAQTFILEKGRAQTTTTFISITGDHS